MKHFYTDDQLDFLREGYKQMQIPELTVAFNDKFRLSKSPAAIKATLSNHKMTCGRPRGVPTGTYFSMTNEQAEYLRVNYKRMTIASLTIAFNQEFNLTKSVAQIRAFTRNHAMKSGRTGCFEKGRKPWNTGSKGLVKPNSGNFKKGQVPATAKPLGSERICTKDGYILVKIAEPNPHTGAPTRYRAKHQVIWEQEYGPIPAKHIVAFKDGNKLNCHIGNLVLLTRAENLYLNRYGYTSIPADFREVMRSIAKVAVKTFDLEKMAEGKKDGRENSNSVV